MAAPVAATASALSPSVYVGGLHPEVQESHLYEHFRSAGNVVSTRVCVDAHTNKSLGYGYVNFQNPTEAERAIDTLNGTKILNQPCRVSRVQRDPTQRKSGVANIVVKGLQEGMDDKALRELFGKYGRITSLHIPVTEVGAPKGHAYVNFDKEDAAVKAIEETNGLESNGATLTVEAYKTQSAFQQDALKSFTNLYIKNLAENVDEAKLREVFGAFGPITSLKIRIDEEGKSMCFGFVAFEKHEDAVKAIQEFDEKPHEIAGPEKNICVRRFQNKRERRRVRDQAYRERQASYAKYPNLYIKNLDDDVTSERLEEVFSRFGETKSVRVQMDKITHQSRGFGFVSFVERSAADKALQEMPGSHELGVRPLFVTMALRRDARQQARDDMNRMRGGFPNPNRMMPGGMGPSMGGGMGGGMGMGPMGSMGPRGMGMQQPMGGPMGGMGMGMGGGMPMGGMGVPRPVPGMGGPMPGPMNMHPMMAGGGPMARQPPRPQPVQQPKSAQPQHLDSATLANMTPEQQKNVLGERLYSYISRGHPQAAAKITGMLLEMDNSEILNLLDSPQLLENKVKEAQDVLKRHET